MQQKNLDFIVDDQFIRAPHYTVVADSKDYLVARFTFSEQWQDLVKTAVFHGADGKAYYVVLENDTCLVPHEVIQPTRFLVSVFGGDRLTTDRAMVEVAASGFTSGGITPPTPTPDVYNQLMETVCTDRQLAEAAATTAAEKAELCTQLTATAEELVQGAEKVPALVSAAATADVRCRNFAKDAQAYADEAQTAATQAETFAAQTAKDAETATTSATQAGTHASASYVFSEEARVSAAQAEAAANDAAAAVQAAKNEWQLLQTVDVTEPTDAISCTFTNLGLKELYFEGTVTSQDRTTVLQNFIIGITRSSIIWSASCNFGNASYPKVMTRGHLFLSPGGTLLCDATVSLYGYTLDSNGKSFTSTGRSSESSFTNVSSINNLYLKVAGGFAEGTSFKIWGR